MPSSNLRYAEGPRSAAGASTATPNPTSTRRAEVAKPVADPRVEETQAKQHPVGARSVQTILERSFLPGVEDGAVDEAPSAKKRLVNAVTARRFAKIALGIGLVIAFGWAPLRAMLATTSVEAIVNARIETIRAPIEGIVQAPGEKTANWSATAAPPKLIITNPYADRSRLDELRRDLNALEFAGGDARASIAIDANCSRCDRPSGRKISGRPPQADRRKACETDGGPSSRERQNG